MDSTANQQQLLSNLPVDISSDAEITEQTALVGEVQEEPPAADNIEWNTSVLSQVRKKYIEILFYYLSSKGLS